MEEYLNLIEERPELFRSNNELNIVMNYELVREFEKNTGRKIGIVYQSRYNLLVVDLVENTNGDRFAYERLIPAVKKRSSHCNTNI